MASNRGDLLDWLDQGGIAPENLRAAMETAGVLPGSTDWRRFVDHILLYMGVVMLAAGVVFFFAFNWQELGRYAKFALVEAPIVAGLALVWRVGVEGAAGKATLLFLSLMTGAFLALVGQTYQTGADTFELFAVWATAILPWVLVARFPALWVFWLLLLNVAVSLYFHTFGLFWGMLFAPDKLIWLLFALNTLALVVWEALAVGGLLWLRGRWPVRILATASGGLVTALGVENIVDWRGSSHWGAPAWCAWIASAYVVYRYKLKDVYVLAGGVLSFIVMASVVLAKGLRMQDAGALLLIGMVVIGLSAGGGYWLKGIAAEEES